MGEDFKRILLLTDFSGASSHAAEEAAMIAIKFNSELHILHVSSNSRLSWLLAPEAYFIHLAENKEKYSSTNTLLKKLQTELGARFGLNVQCHEAEGKLCEIVNKYVDELQIDLVVLGAKRESWLKELLFESKAKDIVRSVNSEVLCVYAESNSTRLKKIVLPIGKHVPKRKIKLAYELARKFAANVHLISLTKNGRNLSREDTKTLMGSYQYFKDITNIPIECKTVFGSNLAQATVQYAENIGADLILVNTGPESFFKNKKLRRWSGNIVDHSSIPVLCVHAINEKKVHRPYSA
ncbi:MAG TPA: universal stress protein [Chitinophagaceae bacterium]